RPRETEVAGLGGGVVGLAELALLAVDRRNVDDAAELARPHAFNHLATYVDQAIQIRANDCVPLRPGHLVKCRIAGDAGVVDENVDRPERGFHGFHATGTRIVISDVPSMSLDAGFRLKRLGRTNIAGVSS